MASAQVAVLPGTEGLDQTKYKGLTLAYRKRDPELLPKVRLTKFIPKVPTVKQAFFLMLSNFLEVFFGGAAAGGKSEALLMAALQYVDVPDYRALILRRTYSQLNMPNSILDRCHQWLRPWVATGEVRWMDKKMRFEWPKTGATLQFGYLALDKHVYNYDGPEYHFVGYDELTQFKEFQYTFLFGRMRRATGSHIPVRMRGASNPGGVGHVWAKNRFIKFREPGVIYVPALLEDNPYADKESYLAALEKLDPVTRAQRRWGNWDVTSDGLIFKRAWFDKVVDAAPALCKRVRYWDLAASEGKGDWTAGVLLAQHPNKRSWFIEDVKRVRFTANKVKELIKTTAQKDGYGVPVVIEQEGGSAGKFLIAEYTLALAGFDVKGVPSTGKKHIRWRPFAVQAEAGNIHIVAGRWNNEFVEELCSLSPDDKEYEFDDQGDAVSGAFNHFTQNTKYFDVSSV